LMFCLIYDILPFLNSSICGVHPATLFGLTYRMPFI
jgi:hypothetical protein